MRPDAFREEEREHQMFTNEFFQANVAELARHLPPSGATLRLIDLGCAPASVAGALLALRPDLQIVGLDESLGMLHEAQTVLQTFASNHVNRVLQAQAHHLPFADNSADAILAHHLSGDYLGEVRRVLRPGGRLIVFDSAFGVEHPLPKAMAQTLDSAGFARLLVERGVGDYGILVRGEKPNSAPSTAPVAPPIDFPPDGLTPVDAAQMAQTPGRYVFLLIRQTPNRPAWSLAPWTNVAWDAAAIDSQLSAPVVLAFSSLPKAVAFMQPAVTANALIGVTRIAKFDKTIAAHWSFPILLNPDFAALHASKRFELPGAWLSIDPADAQLGDE